MTEASLFLIISFVAIASAAAMLLSSNAVHSALFLIVIMGCIAFLFLMLDAPFLFLVQITVYAGAIMVLFLFVIMLLGAEKLGGKSSLFRWMTPAAMVLALLFLGAAAVALGQVSGGTEAAAAGNPLVRVAHFAPEVGQVDIYANNELIAEAVGYGGATDFMTVPAGEYNLALFAAGTQDALLAQSVTLQAGDALTALAYGTVPQIALVDHDLSTVSADENTRIAFFNAFDNGEAALADLGSEFDPNDTRVLVGPVAYAASAEAVELHENTDVNRLAFVDAAGATLFPLRNPDIFGLRRGTLQFFVLTAEQAFDGTVRARAFPLVTETAPAFGGPVAIGRDLFTRYLLPMQMVAVLLLVAMIGAIVLTHKPGYKPRQRRDERRKVSRPLTSVIAAQTGHDVITPDDSGMQKLPEPAAEVE